MKFGRWVGMGLGLGVCGGFMGGLMRSRESCAAPTFVPFPPDQERPLPPPVESFRQVARPQPVLVASPPREG